MRVAEAAERHQLHAEHLCNLRDVSLATSARRAGPPLPHLRWDWARPCRICAGTGLAPCHICAGTGLALAHICTGTALAHHAARRRTCSGLQRVTSASRARHDEARLQALQRVHRDQQHERTRHPRVECCATSRRCDAPVTRHLRACTCSPIRRLSAEPLALRRCVCMQHASYTVQHARCKMQHAAYNRQHTTCSIQHAAYNRQHATTLGRAAPFDASSAR
jgi:hypothetical protein